MRAWSVRCGGVRDLAGVLALWETPDVAVTVTDSAEGLRALLAFDARAVFVADAGGEVVGSLIVGWNGWRGSFYRLAVAPAFRRCGIASALVCEGERRLRELGARRLDAIVTTSEPDAAAVSFWEAAGYELQGDRVRFVRNLRADL